MEKILLDNEKSMLDIKESNIDDSKIVCASLQRVYFEDVNLEGSKIINANMTDFEIEGAQMGGAFIHNVGMPPPSHPMYDINAKQKPMRFEDCNLGGSTISRCDLSGITILDCKMDGLTINGISIEELMEVYSNR